MKLATFRSSSTKRMRIVLAHYLRTSPAELPSFKTSRPLAARHSGLLPFLKPPSVSFQIIPDELSSLHYKLDTLEFADVLQRVTGYGNYIGVRSLFDRPNVVCPAQHFCRDNRCGLNGLRWRHTIFNQVLKFLGLGPMRKGADSAAERDFNSPGNGKPPAFFTQLFQAIFAARRLGVRNRVSGKRIVVGGQLEVDSLLFHQVGCCRIQIDGVLDCV